MQNKLQRLAWLRRYRPNDPQIKKLEDHIVAAGGTLPEPQQPKFAGPMRPTPQPAAPQQPGPVAEEAPAVVAPIPSAPDLTFEQFMGQPPEHRQKMLPGTNKLQQGFQANALRDQWLISQGLAPSKFYRPPQTPAEAAAAGALKRG